MITKEANIRNIDSWKTDSWESVEFYNNWFIHFAPEAFRTARKNVLKDVRLAFEKTKDLTYFSTDIFFETPQIMEALRMITAPPLAQDRLTGLSYSKKSLLKNLENGKKPKRLDIEATESIKRMLNIISSMIDRDLFPWLEGKKITAQQRLKSASVVADRLTGALSNPIIRNAQEKRQLDSISNFLKERNYTYVQKIKSFEDMKPLSYAFHVNVPVLIGNSQPINMPIDVVIRTAGEDKYPLLLECKSAGDFTNTNKRRKEEAVKIMQLRETYGRDISLYLFLCGYFDTGYLGYEAAEGIDWIWEHRIADLEKLGV